jgi:hypothetical protein
LPSGVPKGFSTQLQKLFNLTLVWVEVVVLAHTPCMKYPWTLINMDVSFPTTISFASCNPSPQHYVSFFHLFFCLFSPLQICARIYARKWRPSQNFLPPKLALSVQKWPYYLTKLFMNDLRGNCNQLWLFYWNYIPLCAYWKSLLLFCWNFSFHSWWKYIGYNFVKHLMGMSISNGTKKHVESQWKQSNFEYMFMHWHFKIMVNMGNCVKWFIWMLKSSKYKFISSFDKRLLNFNNNFVKYGQFSKGLWLKTFLIKKFWSKCFWENNNLLYTFKNIHNLKDVEF